MAHQLSSTTRQQRRALGRFFARFPRWVVLALAVGVALLVLGAEPSIDPGARDLAVAAGIGLLGVGVARAAMWVGLRPSAAQVDEWLDRDLAELRQRAEIKCGLTGLARTSKPLVLTGPEFDEQGAEYAYRESRHGEVRFTPVAVTILNFSEHEIFAYACTLDRLTGTALSEGTDEFFYRDVVSVTTNTDDLSIDKHGMPRSARKLLKKQIRGGKLRIPKAQRFVLTTTGGTTVEVVVSVVLDKLKRVVMGPGGDVDNDPIDAAIAQMRQMVREKKIPAPGE